MGRGRSSSGSRGRSSSGSRGRSSSSFRSSGRYRRRNSTTVIIGGESYDSSSSTGRGTLIFMAIILLLFGIAAIWASVKNIIENSQYAPVEAVCLDNDRVGSWYYTTYSYSVDGIDYENRSTEGWEFEEIIGNTVTIYYFKANPNKISEKLPASGETLALTIIIGLVFSAVGVYLIVRVIKAKGKKSDAENETPETPIKEQTDATCVYCDSKYSKKLNSCPNCGASRR